MKLFLLFKIKRVGDNKTTQAVKFVKAIIPCYRLDYYLDVLQNIQHLSGISKRLAKKIKLYYFDTVCYYVGILNQNL